MSSLSQLWSSFHVVANEPRNFFLFHVTSRYNCIDAYLPMGMVISLSFCPMSFFSGSLTILTTRSLTRPLTKLTMPPRMKSKGPRPDSNLTSILSMRVISKSNNSGCAPGWKVWGKRGGVTREGNKLLSWIWRQKGISAIHKELGDCCVGFLYDTCLTLSATET